MSSQPPFRAEFPGLDFVGQRPQRRSPSPSMSSRPRSRAAMNRPRFVRSEEIDERTLLLLLQGQAPGQGRAFVECPRIGDEWNRL